MKAWHSLRKENREDDNRAVSLSLASTFEKLHRTLMLFSSRPSIERPKVLSPAGLGIFLSRVQPVFARLQFSDHVIQLL
jgi:hypothetical protein